MGNRILIVDDEKEMRKLIVVCLQSLHYDIDEAGSGHEAITKINEISYDLALFDVMMPNMNGLELLRHVREQIAPKLPIVLLTALGETDQIVAGLNGGADDYVVKPFEPKELVARISSVLRRTKRGHVESKDEDVRTIHGLTFQPEKLKVSYKDETISLTKKEFQLFIRLAEHPGRIYSREKLLDLEWDHMYEGDTRTVDAHIKNIREKFKKVNYTKHIIETVWGIGYQMLEEK